MGIDQVINGADQSLFFVLFVVLFFLFFLFFFSGYSAFGALFNMWYWLFELFVFFFNLFLDGYSSFLPYPLPLGKYLMLSTFKIYQFL